MFEPIAIIGRSCILPGADSPQKLWDIFQQKQDLVSSAPSGRWRIDMERAIQENGVDASWTDRGGYVTQDVVFDHPDYVGLDPLFHWTAQCAQEAMKPLADIDPKRIDLILANLSFPTEGMSKSFESIWFSKVGIQTDGGDPRNQMMSGLPAIMAADVLGIRDGFSLDAACASAVYALKLGAMKLALKESDAILVGAINRADPLFIHHGFSALKALSKSGKSRPFHPEADGLVPSEGCVFVALKRTSDLTDEDEVLGIIRSIGLSNDGRSKGFLAPSRKGQAIAISSAFENCSVSPDQISFVECHATGTQLGDATELEAMSSVYNNVDIGSHKSNLGHSITVSGLVATLKILGIFENKIIPPTLHLNNNTLAGSNVVLEEKSFEGNFAALSAFGFGGNNAHMILQSPSSWNQEKINLDTKLKSSSIGVIAMESIVGDSIGLDGLKKTSNGELDFALATLRFPPNDLKETTHQQLLALKTAQMLVDDACVELDPDRTGVFIGMSCDADVTRFGARWRGEDVGLKADALDVDFAPLLKSAGVIGCMPNVVANRLNTQFDFKGPSFTVSSNALSGLDALEATRLLIAAGDIDHAIVGSVYSPGPNENAQRNNETGNCFLLLVGRDTTQSKNLAILEKTFNTTNSAINPVLDASSEFLKLFGAISKRAKGGESNTIFSEAITEQFSTMQQNRSYKVSSGDRYLQKKVSLPDVAVFHGKSRSEILAKLASRTFNEEKVRDNQACLAMLISSDSIERNAQFQTAIRLLKENTDDVISTKNLSYRSAPIKGEIAFVYTGSAAPSKHFYREMFGTYRNLSVPIIKKVGAENAAEHLAWVFEDTKDRFPKDPDSQIWSVSLASQIHTRLCRDIFGVTPDVAIGFSLGESSMLFALDVWTDLEQMVDDLPSSEIFQKDLSGEYRAVKEAWNESEIKWANWTISGDVQVVKDATKNLDRVHISIINSPTECVISGDENACHSCIETLKKASLVTSKQAYDVAIHVPEVNAIKAGYSKLHRRKTTPQKNIRFYTNATNNAYDVSEAMCSDVIMGQANSTLDFPKTILQAYEDGVRVFIEQGPHQLCTQWIKSILGSKRDYIARSLNPIGSSAENEWFKVAIELIAAGIDVNIKSIRDLFSPLVTNQKSITFSPWKNVKLKNKKKVSTWRRPARLPTPPQTNYFQGAPPTQSRTQEISAVPTLLPTIQTPTDAHTFFLQNQQHVYATFLARFQESQQLLQDAALGSVAQPQLPQVIFEQAPIFPAQKTNSKNELIPSSPNSTALSREDLEFLSHGSIADIWGDIFRPQDDYDVVVRMPKGLLLLADRVTEINAVAGSMKPGNIHTETDVLADSWYLHCGRMPAGIMIESGQADLLLVSYLGVDLLNKGERAYRLLGCKLTYGAALPKVGETLHYDISIDGFAKHGDVRLFFFHYDCTVGSETRLQVREGQAGFFTDAELAESGGVFWTPEDSEFDPSLAFKRGEKESKLTSFSKKQFTAFAEGDLYSCFGEDFAYGATHTRTPGIWSEENHRFLDEIVNVDFTGGPLGRGYLKATTTIRPDDWYFDGHFYNDPCMPGTLMFEGCLQAMTFFFAARGDTLRRDGWRTEPVPGMEFEMICRGQATPQNEFLEYEIFIESAYLSPEGHPTLIADLLVSVDGLKAFHCRRMALRLVPDWPMTSLPLPAKTTNEDIPFDYPAMLATAVGRPSEAFGDLYSDFDGVKKAPRLPGTPYHFMTRVMEETGRNAMKVGATVSVEYDVPTDAWYFAHNAEMPFAVLLETGLQPCGWLASWVGCALNTKSEVFFRNLDGSGTVFGHVKPTDKVVTTNVVLTKLVKSGETTLVGFDVIMTVDGKPLYNLSTMFGFFPAEALASQAGLEASVLPEISTWKDVPNIEIKKLLMVDEYATHESRIFGRRNFHATDWFFKSHFFQDPVQPGSLGLEAMIQCLKVRAQEEYNATQFSTLLDIEHSWSYRGQVRPHNKETIVDVVVDQSSNNNMVGTGFLWTDGASIYNFSGFGISYE